MNVSAAVVVTHSRRNPLRHANSSTPQTTPSLQSLTSTMATTEEATIQVESEVNTTDTAAAPALPPTLADMSVELPPFWPTDHMVWFLQVEVQFSTQGIAEDSF